MNFGAVLVGILISGKFGVIYIELGLVVLEHPTGVNWGLFLQKSSP